LFEQRAARHQTLLHLISSELHVEIARESLDDFIQPEIDRLQRCQFSG
jgi:hypothetical protein